MAHVNNAAPYPVNDSVVKDAGAAGLSKISVTCAAPSAFAPLLWRVVSVSSQPLASGM
ncbi:MAG: hypothetical protein H7Z77_08955 [Chitinophagaceae bacterium]|nr:hypothetical protein [Polaromonas sp.]